MHEVLRQRLMRRIESLPEEQVYQVLDFIEFLESKYARDLATEASGLQKLAEGLEDKIRKRAMNPNNLREAFQLISAADRALSSVSAAGRQILSDLGSLAEEPEGRPGGRRTGGAVGGGRGAGRPDERPTRPGPRRGAPPSGGPGRDPGSPEGGRGQSRPDAASPGDGRPSERAPGAARERPSDGDEDAP